MEFEVGSDVADGDDVVSSYLWSWKSEGRR